MAIDTLSLFNTLRFAAEQHQYQRRAGYEPLPYINHLIKVTETMIGVAKEEDMDTLLASILHDILEDTDVTVEELAVKFGARVAAIVEELTDDMDLPYLVRKQKQIDGAAALSLPARKIRIADKACNIEDIFSYPLNWTFARKKAYLDNSVEVVQQIQGTHPALEAYLDQKVQMAREILQKNA